MNAKREQIVNTALELFYAQGFHATGVDKIIQTAGVSKKTLYHHFRSKDELVLAALRRRDELFRNWLVRAVQARSKDPRAQLDALFDALGEWFRSKGFSGCMFINASAEFPSHDDPCHIACREHKRMIVDYVRSIAEAAGAKQPERLAEQLNLLMEGAIVEAHVCGQSDAHKKAGEMAQPFIAQAFAD
ncbi:MAG: TetR family transcriptional regulator [Rickettsiales bacterium]|mgnify:CR=1 FL=1|nr:TetR family transcriptional regulator [Rickettsiales bacterium]